MLFILAVVLGLVGVALLLFDATRNRPTRTQPKPAPPKVAAQVGQEEIENPEELRAEPEAAPQRPQRQGLSLQGLPGVGRRERRQWAAEHGFEFQAADELLTQEWQRGPEGPAKHVVVGLFKGTEIRLLDVTGTTLMVARRNAASEVVFLASTQPDEELARVGEHAGFHLYGSDQGAVQRMCDSRALAGLEALPDVTEQVWCEADWVIAQFAKGSHREDWDAAAEALTHLANAAMVLPRRGNTDLPVEFSEIDPTRPMPAAPKVTAEPEEPAAALPEPEHEAVVVELPTRVQKVAKGDVEQRALGGDEVEAIGTGERPQPSDFKGTRILRDLSDGSSIFDDVARDLGTDPLK